MPFQNNGIYFSDMVSNPILSWAFGLFTVLGMLTIAKLMHSKSNVVSGNALGISICFYLLLIILSLILFLSSIVGIRLLHISKIIGYLVLLFGLTSGFQCIKRDGMYKLIQYFKNHKIISSVLILYLLLSIAPVTDADSISYHLATPLQILRNGSNHNIGELWLTARLIGFGEYINMMGLAIGSDCLGALIQWTSMALFILLIQKSFISKYKELVIYALLSIPCLLFLMSTQKHQLSGDLAICTSVILYLLQSKKGFNSKFVLAVLIPIFYAMSLKYTLYLPGLMVILAITGGVLLTRNYNLVFNFIKYSALLYILFLLPLHLFNYFNYGDPVSPFLSSSNKELNSFVRYFTNNSSLISNIVEFWIPKNINFYSTVIGLSGFVFLFGDFKSALRLRLLLLSLIIFSFSILLSLQEARFLLSAFIILILSLLYCENIVGENLWKRALFIQLSINIGLILLTLYRTIPANFSIKKRKECFEKMAFSYSVFKWVDSLALPANSVLVPNSRSHLFINQDYLPFESRYFDKNPELKKKEIFNLTSHRISSKDFSLVDSSVCNLATRNPFTNRVITAYLYKKK